MSNIKRPSLVKPTLETLFHIDFNWWSQYDREWRVFLLSLLSEEDRGRFADLIDGDVTLDWVDPDTGEVKQVDGLQHVLISHTSQQEGFLDVRTSLVESVFRLFLKNGNLPMSILDIAEKLGRDPKPILRTFAGQRVYRGIRPILR